MADRPPLTWVLLALVVQFLGYVFDAVWHGILRPGVEPATLADMTRHLATVHLPLYLGAAAVLGSTVWALRREMGRAGVVLPIAVGGAALSVVGEAWHAYSHLRLDTHSAPLAGLLSLVGYVVAVVAVSLWARTRRRRGARRPDERRAA
jgi:hypothetical protein